MATSDLLASLRDLDVPAAPAANTSGLLIVALVFFGLAVLALIVSLHRRRQRWITEASELLQLAGKRESSEHLLDMTRALRRITLLRHANVHAEGDDWLAWLDAEFRTDYFTAGDGRIFGSDLYRRAAADKAPLHNINADLRRLLRRRWFRPW